MSLAATIARLILFASHVVFGQAAPPSFEVASVKPAAPRGNIVQPISGGDADRVDYSNVSLAGMLAVAFGVRSYQISGPSWLESERYDVVARIPEGSSRDQVPLMLQRLLNERFNLATHRETGELTVYSLLPAKDGARLGKAQEPGSTANAVPDVLPDGTFAVHSRNLQVTKMSLTAFAGFLSWFLERPVIDMTGIQGLYSFSMELSYENVTGFEGTTSGTTPDGGLPPDSAPNPTILNSLRRLGLRLEARKAPMEMLIVDHAEKVPTEN
ncbi:MAG: TIGR03435 family protein [Bryobacteraceae bacterium]|jgi:uncharacterized protein (TIGR03435 family)